MGERGILKLKKLVPIVWFGGGESDYFLFCGNFPGRTEMEKYVYVREGNFSIERDYTLWGRVWGGYTRARGGDLLYHGGGDLLTR